MQPELNSGYSLDCHTAQVQKSLMGRGITIMHVYSAQLKHFRPAPSTDSANRTAIDRIPQSKSAKTAESDLRHRPRPAADRVDRGIPHAADRGRGDGQAGRARGGGTSCRTKPRRPKAGRTTIGSGGPVMPMARRASWPSPRHAHASPHRTEDLSHHPCRPPAILSSRTGYLWCDARIVRHGAPGTTIGMNSIKQRRLANALK